MGFLVRSGCPIEVIHRLDGLGWGWCGVGFGCSSVSWVFGTLEVVCMLDRIGCEVDACFERHLEGRLCEFGQVEANPRGW